MSNVTDFEIRGVVVSRDHVDGKTVVFDLGGVLIDWNPRYLYRRLFREDEAAMERFLGEVCTPEWNREQDAGRSCAEAIAMKMGQYPQHRDMIAAFYGRWEEMLGGVMEDSLRVLGEVRREGVALYVVTNWSRETFPIARSRYEFLSWFDGIVVSGEEGVAKPDAALYRVLFERYGIIPESAFFVDDSLENVETAERLGMTAHRFTTAENLRERLRAFGALP